MARRSHFTVIGWIAGDDLGDLGAGRREGWLDDPSIFAAIHPQYIALSSSSLIFVIASNHASKSRPLKLRINGDGRITAVEWLSFGTDEYLVAIAVGTSDGFLLIYNLDGHLIHKQFVHSGRVLKLRFREIKGSNGSDGGQDLVSGELCVVFSGVIARFDGLDLQSVIKRWCQDGGSMRNRLNINDQDNETFYGRIPFQLWSVGKYGSCVDAAITGLMPPPLLELQSSQRHYCAITIGADAVISAYRLSEDRSRSLVGAILSKVVPVAFSTITSFSKLIWRSEPTAPSKSQPTPQPFAKASALTCLKDSPRKGERLTLSPSGTLAAIADNLGRVLLLDTQALVVVRLWKGYRDASCFFVEMLGNKGKTSFSESKNDYCLCLAIHAPRKGIIEIWKMRTGPRLLTIQCPKGSKILQPSTRTVSYNQSYNPLEIFLLNGDSGQLSVLNRYIG